MIDKEQMIKYKKDILSRIKERMLDQKITQIDLSEKTHINQSMISKLLNGSSSLNLDQIISICVALNMSPSLLLSSENTSINELFEDDNIYSSGLVSENDNFISDASRAAFKGYLNIPFFVYFLSTMNTEEKILKGVLLFEKSKSSKRCGVSLELFTGKKDIEGNDVKKIYKGEMIVSITMSTCYVILVNNEIGEMCFFSFRHMYLFNHEMICRVAEVLTTSSGDNRRPTIHRMIISKNELATEEDKHFLNGQLKLDNTDIIIEKSIFEDLKNSDIVNKSPYLTDFFNEISNKKESAYYILDENVLRSSSIDTYNKILGISLLKEYSLSCKNNKIDSNLDEYIYKYILTRTKKE